MTAAGCDPISSENFSRYREFAMRFWRHHRHKDLIVNESKRDKHDAAEQRGHSTHLADSRTLTGSWIHPRSTKRLSAGHSKREQENKKARCLHRQPNSGECAGNIYFSVLKYWLGIMQNADTFDFFLAECRHFRPLLLPRLTQKLMRSHPCRSGPNLPLSRH